MLIQCPYNAVSLALIKGHINGSWCDTFSLPAIDDCQVNNHTCICAKRYSTIWPVWWLRDGKLFARPCTIRRKQINCVSLSNRRQKKTHISSEKVRTLFNDFSFLSVSLAKRSDKILLQLHSMGCIRRNANGNNPLKQ